MRRISGEYYGRSHSHTFIHAILGNMCFRLYALVPYLTDKNPCGDRAYVHNIYVCAQGASGMHTRVVHRIDDGRQHRKQSTIKCYVKIHLYTTMYV